MYAALMLEPMTRLVSGEPNADDDTDDMVEADSAAVEQEDKAQRDDVGEKA